VTDTPPDPARTTPEFVRDEVFSLSAALARVAATTESNTATIADVALDVREIRAIVGKLAAGRAGWLTGVTGWQRLAMWTSGLTAATFVFVAAVNGFNGVATDPADLPGLHVTPPAALALAPKPPSVPGLSQAEIDRLKALAANLEDFIGTDAAPD